jgi:hypothetical protein
MADYSQPYLPNMLSNALAVNGLQAFFDQKRLNADLQTAGQTAATGDLAGASSQLLGSGHLNEAAKMQNMARQLKDDHLADVKTTYDKLGNLALMAQTPEDWSRAIAAAQSHGIDTKGFDDFATGRPAAIALAGKVGDVLTQEKTRRDIEVAQFRADNERFKDSETYSTTIKGEDGADVPATRMRLRSGEWSEPVRTPAGIDINAPLGIGKKAAPTTEMERTAERFKAQWARENPDAPELSDTEAISAARKNPGGATATFKLDSDGLPRFVPKANEGTRSFAYTPEGSYNLSENKALGGNQAAIEARKQLGSIVDSHAEQLRNLANSPNFENAMMFLRTPDGVRFWTSGIVPPGTPAEAIALRMTIQSLKVEYGNFVGAGHKGAVSEHQDEQTRQIVDQLYQSPDRATLNTGIDTLQHLAKAFIDVKEVGPQSVRGGGAQQQSAAPSDAIAQARDAIRKGAPREKVLQRLRGAGISTEGL